MIFKGIFLLGLISICTGTSVQVPFEKVKVTEPLLAPLDGKTDAAAVPVSDQKGVSELGSLTDLDAKQSELPLPQDGVLPPNGMTGMTEPLTVSADKLPLPPRPNHEVLGLGTDHELHEPQPRLPPPKADRPPLLPPPLPTGTVPILGVGPAAGLRTSPLVPRPLPPQPPLPPLVNGNSVDEPNFIKLYIQDRGTGVYRTEKGEYVRIFKILSPPADLASVSLPAVPVPKPMPMPMPVPRMPVQQRSLPMMTPNIMARGKGVPTGRYNNYYDFGLNDPFPYYYDNSGVNGLGYFGGYPYNYDYTYQYQHQPYYGI